VLYAGSNLDDFGLSLAGKFGVKPFGSNGGPGGVRTLDLMTASHARSQLRHRPLESSEKLPSLLVTCVRRSCQSEPQAKKYLEQTLRRRVLSKQVGAELANGCIGDRGAGIVGLR
jgi:hypothetical protein